MILQALLFTLRKLQRLVSSKRKVSNSKALRASGEDPEALFLLFNRIVILILITKLRYFKIKFRLL